MHPLPQNRGGFCYLEVAHMHAFTPAEPRVYRVVADEQVFVGDPVAYGYDGPKYTYYGPHPLVEVQVAATDPMYCYLAGPHYHAQAPPPAEPSFVLKGDVYWYMGPFAADFERGRPRYAVVNEVRPVAVYSPPVVDIAVAPPGFHAAVVIAPPVRAMVSPPPPPPPPVQVRVVAPPPPSLQLGIGVDLRFGGGPRVIERERVIVRDRHHHHHYKRGKSHDNGRHRGWSKQRKR
jgi:hypothetical protein